MAGFWRLAIPEGPVRRLALGWLGLGVGALGASTVFGLWLLIARTPYLSRLLGAGGGFHTALVLHVGLSVLIWFLAFACLLWTLAQHRYPRVGWGAFGCCVGGALLMLGAPWVGGGRPVMNNYVPVLDSPLFLAGLGLFAGGVALQAAATLVGGLGRRPGQSGAALRTGLYLMAVTVLVAMASLGASWATLPRTLPAPAYFEALFWSAGHILQFAYTLLAMVAWLWIGGAAYSGSPWARRAGVVLFVLTAVPLMAVGWIHWNYAVISPEFRTAFTRLMSYASWPAAMLLGGAVLLGALRNRGPEPRQARRGLGLAVWLFVTGLVAGALIRGDNLMVPAHYHGVIGAVTLSLMALTYRLLPELGFPGPALRVESWQLRSYGWGLLLWVVGLAWSGSQGIARKAPLGGQLPGGLEAVAMGMAALGGGVAIASGLGFLTLMSASLVGGRNAILGVLPPWRRGAAAGGARVDHRLLAAVLTIGLILAGGIAVSRVSGSGPNRWPPPDPRLEPVRHAQRARETEIGQRFQQAVAMLHAKQYEHAAVALHRVLELAPALPEAHVNMGFALVGLERYGAARDFFISATELRPMQVNAYYGLAIALENLGDLLGAMGAMRTYLHLARPDDPYRRKAEAALWEWQAALDAGRPKTAANPER